MLSVNNPFLKAVKLDIKTTLHLNTAIKTKSFHFQYHCGYMFRNMNDELDAEHA